MKQNDVPRYEDWWTEDQQAIVDDLSKVWLKKQFVPSSGYWIQKDKYKVLVKLKENGEVPKEAILEPRAWDHEHCELCFETISDLGTHQHEGFTDNSMWLCTSCFEKYILPRRKQE